MRKGVGVMAGAVLFGLLSGAARRLGGESSGASFHVWSTVANLSAPWLLIPFLAGSTATRPLRGALMGLASTVTALLTFYSAVAMVSPLDGRTGAGAALSWVLANQVYFQAGPLTGPLLGAAGAIWQRRSLRPGRSRVSAGWLGALLLAGEPVVLLALGYAGPLSQSWRSGLPSLLSLPLMWGLTLHRPTATLLVYGGELIAGLALLSLLARRRQKALHSLR